MSMAVYQTENVGHFGLALSHYAHFTSPIRRYPDLLLHRAIKHLSRRQARDKFDYSEKTHGRTGSSQLVGPNGALKKPRAMSMSDSRASSCSVISATVSTALSPA